MNNTIYLRRRSKMCVAANVGELLPLNYAVSISRNLETLGYGLSERLIQALRQLSVNDLETVYSQLVEDLKRLKGAHRDFKPMYPNFPAQVMEMLESKLYLNAIIHYWTGGKYFPKTEAKQRLPLFDDTPLQMIDLGTEAEFEGLFGQIAGSNASLSEQDREDLTWFVESYGNDIARLMPASIPQKENMAFVAGLLMAHTSTAVDAIGGFCKTATDVLRLAVALSGGDVSLTVNSKFRVFKRPERRLLLGLIDAMGNPTEDMLRWKGRWIRLGERLHPGEFRKLYPRAAGAFDVLRNDLPFETFNGKVEQALAAKDVDTALMQLSQRPGDFARRLDHLLRTADTVAQQGIVSAFGSVTQKVSTPVLLQVLEHFRCRGEQDRLRVFFPKGNVAKAQAIENTLPVLAELLCASVVDACTEALMLRFAALPTLGKCYVDSALSDYLVPSSQRSAAKTLRTVARGSKLPLPDADVLRFFVWWKNGKERTDLDLSAALFDADFNVVDEVAYYNLKSDYGGCHSGDIVDAPNGASEFIDVSTSKVLAKGAVYIVMVVTSYTQQPYCDLPECFAGWMARQHAESGEIYEPRTVQDRLDISADTRIAIPVIFDLVNRRAIWCDAALRSHPKWQNNVAANRGGIQMSLRAFLDMRKTSLYDLLMLHVKARGEAVAEPEEAQTVFSVASGTPFQLETIASEYMA